MKIIVFGASSPTGRLVMEQALAAGHQVTAYARRALDEPRVSVVRGTLDDAAAIAAAIAGQQAVVSVLGPKGPAPQNGSRLPVTEGTRNIIAGMKAHGVTRLIATATPSAADPLDGFALSFYLAVRAIKLLVPSAYREILGVADAVRHSDLDWTLLRLPMLNNKPVEQAAAGYVGDPRIALFWLSREPLAKFIVEQLTSASWSQRAPVLSNG